MARKRVFKEVAAPKTPVLDSLGLEKGLDVQYRQRDGQDWSKGRLMGENKDGSLSIFDTYTGHTRAMLVENVQVRTVGPRGGVKWVPCTEYSGLVSR